MKQLIEQFMLDKGLSYCEFGLDVENEGGEEVDVTILKGYIAESSRRRMYHPRYSLWLPH